jgi:hypothetical protein
MLALLSIAVVVTGCDSIPYRTAGFEAMPGCDALYERYPDHHKIPEPESGSACWKRSIEERKNYDLLFAEFDDQGWVQQTSDLKRPHEDFLDQFSAQLEQLRAKFRDRGLSLVVFTHGWHHNAAANDSNVREFRALLRDLVIAEGGESGRRVVGIYVGWRGDSIDIPYVNNVTFWERKNTAEKVAQGSVRELFLKLDLFRDRANHDNSAKKVRMLTIGHSFGGLITYESLSSEFMRASTRYDENEKASCSGNNYLARFGDLVVLANPAFEGLRYESLMIAGQRLKCLADNQLPVMIVATTRADWATGFAFPWARFFSTLFERTPNQEFVASFKTVGHNERYITHSLSICSKNDQECLNTCKQSIALSKEVIGAERRDYLAMEIARAKWFARNGINRDKGREYLCDGLQLSVTQKWQPRNNPFWVVQTTSDIMDGHGDIFNDNFVAFIRQMYLAVILATD